MEVVVRQETISFYGGLENLSIIHISDIHLWYSTRVLQKLQTLITLNSPDLIILTGDYYDLPKGASNFREFLCTVSLKHTIVFIKGNHDNIYGAKTFNLLFNIPNCFSVETEIYKFQSKRGNRYYITSWENRNNLPQMGNGKNIVLIHDPEKIKEKELSNIHLILAGHLHGGQFVFFKTKNNANFPACLLYKHCTDRKNINETILIVSKGLGDTFPFRINCPREIVKISIK